MTKSTFELGRRDFPKGEPVFKMKRGALWRQNACGYTNDITQAHQYSREEALSYCFKGTTKNGGEIGDEKTYAVPVRMELAMQGLHYDEIIRRIKVLRDLLKYAEKRTTNPQEEI